VGIEVVAAAATAALPQHILDSDVVLLEPFEAAISGVVFSAYYLPVLKLQMSDEGDSMIRRHTCRRSEENSPHPPKLGRKKHHEVLGSLPGAGTTNVE
jgi:hypothetical protein